MTIRIRHIIAILLALPFCAFSQQLTDDCIYIDFETIPEGTLFDGMDIFDQYSERFGVTFSLENGAPVKLAEVGAPATAFGGAFGSDTPAPGQGVGQFFLTDDGQLSGLASTPIFIDFFFPMDSVSGCILDMDFQERFIVTAYGEGNAVIHIDTIFAGGGGTTGDPGTGDALCSPWGVRLDDCSGSIHRIKLDGYRDTPGAFGLGVDKLSFCKFGATPSVDFLLDQKDITCGAESGSITVTTLTEEGLLFSVDGSPFESSLDLPELTEGVYEITVIDESGCEEVFPISIDEFQEPEIMGVLEVDTECGLDNGTITLDIEGGVGDIQATIFPPIDGQENVVGGVFTDVPPGEYQIFIVDLLGCVDNTIASVAPSPGPQIIGAVQEDASCDLSNGEITLGATAPTDFIEYSIDGGPWQSGSTFQDLAPGDYTLTIQDDMGCTRDTMITIDAYPILELRDVVETVPECLQDNGTITVTYDGGVGDVEYSIDGGFTYQLSNVFTGLAPGSYQIIIKDEKDCELLVDALVPPYICPVYVGNIFAPNNNGANEFFPVITAQEYAARILKYSIYDRWGELIYNAENFDIHDDTYYWDGTFHGKDVVFGVYVYLIEVGHVDGSVEYLSGDVTMIK